jgi:hypothetical protein
MCSRTTTRNAGSDGIPAAVIVYAGNLAAIGLVIALLSMFAWRRELYATRPGRRQAVTGLSRALVPVVVFVGSMPIALWRPDYAELSWVVVFPAVRLAGAIARGRWD